MKRVGWLSAFVCALAGWGCESTSPDPAEALEIVTEAFPVATVGRPYMFQIRTRGARGRVTFGRSEGALPLGLSLDEHDGTISGAPTRAGESSFTLRASDESGRSSERSFVLSVEPRRLEITTRVLPTAHPGESYLAKITARGGDETIFRWRIAEGRLPRGLTLTATGTPSGRILGLPTETGRFELRVEVLDATGARAEAELSLHVFLRPSQAGDVEIITRALPTARVNAAYEATIGTRGFSSLGIEWSVVDGRLPPGMRMQAFSTRRARITGTSTAAGTYEFRVRAVDINGSSDEAELSVQVHPRLEITSTAPPFGTTTVDYEWTVTATGGSGRGYRWRVSRGILPFGVELAERGTPVTRLAGRPALSGFSEFEIEVEDDAGTRATKSFRLEVRERLFVITQQIPHARPDAPYSAAVEAVGGTPPYTWSVTNGRLPSGIDVLEEGTPITKVRGQTSQRGTFNFDLTVTDSRGATTPHRLRLHVGEPMWAVVVGDVEIDEDIGVYAVNIAGPQAGPLIPIHPPAPNFGDAVPNRSGAKFSPDATMVAFAGDFRVDDSVEIFLTELSDTTPRVGRLVSERFQPFGSATWFEWSPDSRYIAYVADQKTDDVFELFLIDVRGPRPGTVRRLSGEMVANGDVTEGSVKWSPDSTKVAYVADQLENGVRELFVTDIRVSTSSVARRVNPDMVVGADVATDYQWGDDVLIYRADQIVRNREELFAVSLNFGIPGVAQRINGPLANGGDVRGGEFLVSPDRRRLLYIADETQNNVDELFVADLGVGSVITRRKANVPFPDTRRDVFSAKWAPDSQSILYVSDARLDSVNDLYLVDVLTGDSTRVNPAFTSFEDVSTNRETGYGFSPDGTKIAYRADEAVNGSFELFVVYVSEPQPWLIHQINPPLNNSDADVDAFFFGPQSDRIAFLGDVFITDAIDLYVASLATRIPSVPGRANTSLPPTGFVASPVQFRPDGTAVVYRADQVDAGTFEGYIVLTPNGVPGIFRAFTPPLPRGGSIEQIFVQPTR